MLVAQLLWTPFPLVRVYAGSPIRGTRRQGGVIEYGEYPDPEIDRDEVLVDIKAAALNHLDIWTRRGMPGIDLEMPHIPGSDGAGVVEDVGEDVTRFEAGDHVALSAGVGDLRMDDPTLDPRFHIIGEHVTGVHSEYAAIPEDNLIPVPDHVDWSVAGSSSLVFQTAWRMLIERADLEAGESVLVLGASGGVGGRRASDRRLRGCGGVRDR